MSDLNYLNLNNDYVIRQNSLPIERRSSILNKKNNNEKNKSRRVSFSDTLLRKKIHNDGSAEFTNEPLKIDDQSVYSNQNLSDYQIQKTINDIKLKRNKPQYKYHNRLFEYYDVKLESDLTTVINSSANRLNKSLEELDFKFVEDIINEIRLDNGLDKENYVTNNIFSATFNTSIYSNDNMLIDNDNYSTYSTSIYPNDNMIIDYDYHSTCNTSIYSNDNMILDTHNMILDTDNHLKCNTSIYSNDNMILTSNYSDEEMIDESSNQFNYQKRSELSNTNLNNKSNYNNLDLDNNNNITVIQNNLNNLSSFSNSLNKESKLKKKLISRKRTSSYQLSTPKRFKINNNSIKKILSPNKQKLRLNSSYASSGKYSMNSNKWSFNKSKINSINKLKGNNLKFQLSDETDLLFNESMHCLQLDNTNLNEVINNLIDDNQSFDQNNSIESILDEVISKVKLDDKKLFNLSFESNDQTNLVILNDKENNLINNDKSSDQNENSIKLILDEIISKIEFNENNFKESIEELINSIIETGNQTNLMVLKNENNLIDQSNSLQSSKFKKIEFISDNEQLSTNNSPSNNFMQIVNDDKQLSTNNLQKLIYKNNGKSIENSNSINSSSFSNLNQLLPVNNDLELLTTSNNIQELTLKNLESNFQLTPNENSNKNEHQINIDQIMLNYDQTINEMLNQLEKNKPIKINSSLLNNLSIIEKELDDNNQTNDSVFKFQNDLVKNPEIEFNDTNNDKFSVNNLDNNNNNNLINKMKFELEQQIEEVENLMLEKSFFTDFIKDVVMYEDDKIRNYFINHNRNLIKFKSFNQHITLYLEIEDRSENEFSIINDMNLLIDFDKPILKLWSDRFYLFYMNKEEHFNFINILKLIIFRRFVNLKLKLLNKYNTTEFLFIIEQEIELMLNGISDFAKDIKITTLKFIDFQFESKQDNSFDFCINLFGVNKKFSVILNINYDDDNYLIRPRFNCWSQDKNLYSFDSIKIIFKQSSKEFLGINKMITRINRLIRELRAIYLEESVKNALRNWNN